eukprot:CAMPEP_0179104644 /NCGR_PEP_ID=MMETSP0796-20121207/48553_1 /TAXON_ID=73915 /ORGANISM="Pyrodinium bahamense, Strain pbaha01" /LENGTH=42 /DNA_ID= /DNA_START= /DNA_END= /DNA_ORIENTATION=
MSSGRSKKRGAVYAGSSLGQSSSDQSQNLSGDSQNNSAHGSN